MPSLYSGSKCLAKKQLGGQRLCFDNGDRSLLCRTLLSSHYKRPPRLMSNISNIQGDQKPITTAPTAPDYGLLLNNEDGSDIVFMVGNLIAGDRVWRFPAHSFVIENASEVFKTIVVSTCQPYSNRLEISENKCGDSTPTHHLSDCNPEIFQILLR